MIGRSIKPRKLDSLRYAVCDSTSFIAADPKPELLLREVYLRRLLPRVAVARILFLNRLNALLHRLRLSFASHFEEREPISFQGLYQTVMIRLDHFFQDRQRAFPGGFGFRVFLQAVIDPRHVHHRDRDGGMFAPVDFFLQRQRANEEWLRVGAMGQREKSASPGPNASC